MYGKYVQERRVTTIITSQMHCSDTLVGEVFGQQG